MTFLISEIIYWIIIAIVFIGLVFVSSLTLQKWFKKKDKLVTKRMEMVTSVLLTVFFIGIYFAFQEQLTLKVYEGDLVVTDERTEQVQTEQARVISTEKPMVIYHLYTLGFYDRFTIAEGTDFELQVSIQTIDFVGLYEQFEEGDYQLQDGAFHFAAYYSEEILPYVEEMYVYLLEQGYEQTALLSTLEQNLVEQFPKQEITLSNIE